jgi:hypothetical protein
MPDIRNNGPQPPPVHIDLARVWDNSPFGMIVKVRINRSVDAAAGEAGQAGDALDGVRQRC